MKPFTLARYGTSVMLLACLFYSSMASANLLPNPGFEDGSNGAPTSWSLHPRETGLIEWIDTDAHSGNRAMRLTASTPELSGVLVRSSAIAVPAEAMIKVSAWIKAENVDRCGDRDLSEDCRTWHHLRLTVTALDADGAEIRPHHDFISTDGDVCAIDSKDGCDWKQVHFNFITPVGTAAVRLDITVHNATGTAWIDDVTLDVIQEKPVVDLTGLAPPIVFPQPWKFASTDAYVPLGDVAILNSHVDTRLTAALEAYCLQQGIHCAVNPSEGSYQTWMLVGDASSPFLNYQLTMKYPSNNWEDLGTQGYFLSVQSMPPTLILLGANTEQGRFYALQSLKQLISGGNVYFADMLDRPEVERRGMIMGVQWFRQNQNAIDRLALLKGNTIINHGSFLSNRLLRRWREPFTESNLNAMAAYLERAKTGFMATHIDFGPRSCATESQCTNLDPAIDYGPTRYSDDSDIELIVGKMSQLYQIGFRSFGLNFDDLNNTGEDVLSWEGDIDRFSNNIGKAHRYFTQQIYERLIARHPDVHFTVLPMWYSRPANFGSKKVDYLRELAELPQSIEFTSVPVSDADRSVMAQLTGRPSLVWSNYFSKADTDPTYRMPYLSFMYWKPLELSGFTFLPAMPTQEQDALVSWYSAMEYAWAPSRYDAMSAFQRDAARYEWSLLP